GGSDGIWDLVGPLFNFHFETDSHLDRHYIGGFPKHAGIPPLYFSSVGYLCLVLCFSVSNPLVVHELDRRSVGDPLLRFQSFMYSVVHRQPNGDPRFRFVRLWVHQSFDPSPSLLFCTHLEMM
ncbi:hypothetical protein HAX54_051074, partial [Datura stramonium]|nr:hypothetical protein [Datura stramonium]